MSDISAWAWHYALLAYGRGIPYHPGKWRAFEKIWPKTMAAWRDPEIVRRGGIRYELERRHHIDRYIYYLTYEAAETRTLKRMIKPGWVVIDGGANIGYYTLLFSRLVGPTGCVYAFEPSTPNRRSLARNLELNSVTNVRTCEMALSDGLREAGMSWFRGDGLGNPGKAALADTGASDEVVQTTTLDHFVNSQGLSRIDFIKVDIEGAECPFLRGARNVLLRFRPRLLLELNPDALRVFGSTPSDLLGILESHGYRVQTTTWRGVRPLARIPEGGDFCNIVAYPTCRDPDASREQMNT